MNIENHFKNFSDFENKIQNLKILEFVEHFEIKNLKNLRNLNSWSEMENSVLKKKIYNKVYYLEKRDKESGAIDVPEDEVSKTEIEKSDISVNDNFSSVCDTPQISHKPKNSNMNYLFTGIVAVSLLFLMNESRLFYLSFGFSSFNSYLLPVLVEVSILLLSTISEIKARILMILLILYNVVSFSFFTYGQFDQNYRSSINNASDLNLLKEEKSLLFKEKLQVSSSLAAAKKEYARSLKTNFKTRANRTFLPRILDLEKRYKEINDRVQVINQNVSKLRDKRSLSVILVGTISLIFLKMVLQLTSILFLRKINFKRF